MLRRGRRVAERHDASDALRVGHGQAKGDGAAEGVRADEDGLDDAEVVESVMTASAWSSGP